jgi:hypothetical protein
MRSISMLWTLWTTVAVMPYTWLSVHKPLFTGADYEWEISSDARQRLLGPDASMLVAGFQAYCMLPGRVVGSMHCSDQDDQTQRSARYGTYDSSATSNRQSTSTGRANEPTGNVRNIREESTRSFSPSNFPDVPQYYNTRHFKRVGNHAPVAWDDCMWLLMLQERESSMNAKPGGNSQSSHLAHHGNVVEGMIEEVLETYRKETIETPSSKEKEDSKSASQPQAASSQPNVQNTAFGYFENEFMLMKPFLMYNAVYAGSIAVSNVCYMDTPNAHFMHNVIQSTGLCKHLMERGHGTKRKHCAGPLTEDSCSCSLQHSAEEGAAVQQRANVGPVSTDQDTAIKRVKRRGFLSIQHTPDPVSRS